MNNDLIIATKIGTFKVVFSDIHKAYILPGGELVHSAVTAAYKMEQYANNLQKIKAYKL